ncbi:MAG: ATP-dependent Clp protease ATP-binding subunit [Bacteroidales bacterium]|nr:ATP-dependent Clp protease ATP-binding subunit [Bacteroidales bacterium]
MENNNQLLNLAAEYAKEYCNDAVYPAHLFKALLHKDTGLIDFLESTLDKDYFYLQEWADVQMQLAPKAMRPNKHPEASSETQAVLDEAENYNLKMGLADEDPLGLLAAVVTPGVGFSFDQLKTLPLNASEICDKVPASGKAGSASSPAKPTSHSNDVAQYTIDMCADYRAGKYGPVIGFESELSEIYEILGRKNKSSVLIVGETGVGKTSLVRKLVEKISDGSAPAFLQGNEVLELDLAAIGADASYRGEAESRLKNILTNLREGGRSILVIEGIDRIFDKQSNLYGLSTILKQELAKVDLHLVATTAIDGYTKNLETDKEFVSKVEKLSIDEPDAQLCQEIIEGIIDEYNTFHGLTTEADAIAEAIQLSKRYLTERSLPDSAIGLIDRTMSQVKTANDISADGEKRQTVGKDDLYAVVAKLTGIPLGKVQSSERERLINGEEILKKRVVGQDHAVKKVLDAVFEARSGLNKKGQPMGSFFFLGPTGTGKTELSKALAEFLFNDESALLRFDMSEFKEEHSVALLYGAPPGYVGYEEGGLLVNKIRQKPYSVVLFDEIEKAHKSVFDLFLQILDEGKLHDRLGRVGDFSNALILFTSNIGSKFIVDTFNKGQVPQSNTLMDIMQDYFRPEFLGRLTEIIPFSPITEETVTRIFQIHLKGLLKLLDAQNIKLEIDEDTMHHIAMKGFNPQYGARPIIGIIRKELRNPLSKLIIAGKVKSGDTVKVGIKDGEVEFKV